MTRAAMWRWVVQAQSVGSGGEKRRTEMRPSSASSNQFSRLATAIQDIVQHQKSSGEPHLRKYRLRLAAICSASLTARSAARVTRTVQRPPALKTARNTASPASNSSNQEERRENIYRTGYM